jgi:hypothetical protein
LQRRGFEKARARLVQAFKAHEALKEASSLAEYESAWTLLLTALNSVYTILEQSCKGSARSEQWFAKAKRQRRTDEFLRYLHHARNADEHGLAEVLVHEPAALAINGGGGGIYIDRLIAGPDGIVELKGAALNGGPLQVTKTPSRIVLKSVRDRGVIYDPPKTFLGEPLDDASPVGVGGAALEFLVHFFVEAETLLVPA